MAIMYPREMVFGVTVTDPKRVAILAAADELHLPNTRTDATVSITVDSPQQAYRFGVATRKYLPAGQAPNPIDPPREAVDELEHR